MTNAELAKVLKGGHKYRAQRTTCAQGDQHPSKKEARRCDELHLMQRGGLISMLTLQRRYPLVVNGIKIGEYVADFSYRDEKTKVEVTEDSKGVATRVFRIKKKLMWALYGIAIKET